MSDNVRKPRILIVEDDEDQRMLLCEALGMYYQDAEGRNIHSASSAAECLANDLTRFDVVLLDYNLPDMSGLDLLDRIRQRVSIPVIFVTGENNAATATEAIRRGAQDYVIKLGDYLFAIPLVVEKNIRQYSTALENERLQRQLQETLAELQEKNVQLQDSLARLRNMASTNHLTGLSNRRWFSEMLERSYGEAVRYGFDLSCCMCDLDHYKQLNDSLGHQVGDQVLITAADVIRGSLRGADVAARYGGDEFVLLLPHTSVERAIAVGDRIRRELVERTSDYSKLGHGVTMSMGVASLESDRPANADALVAMADRALYTAKDRGKDRIVAHCGMQAKVVA